MPFVRKKKLVCLSTTLSLLLLALGAWALPRAFRLHQPVPIRQLEAPAADFLGRVCARTHLEVVQEFPLHLVVTADTDPAFLEKLQPALVRLYNLDEANGEQLLVVPGQPPFYWSDQRPLALGVTLLGLLLMLPGAATASRRLKALWKNRPGTVPTFRPAGGFPLPNPLGFLRRRSKEVPTPPLTGASLVALILSCYKPQVTSQILAEMPQHQQEQLQRLQFCSGTVLPSVRRRALAYFQARLDRETGRYANDAARFAAVLAGEIARSQAAPKPRKRRYIYSCVECYEVFSDEESLRRHEVTHGKTTGRLRGLLVWLLAGLTGATTFGVLRWAQHYRPQPSLQQWIQDDLRALVSNRIEIGLLERNGQVSALLASDPSLHPLLLDRTQALGLEPGRVFCLPLEAPRWAPAWLWAGLPGLLLVAGWRARRRPAPAKAVHEDIIVYAPVKKTPALSIREQMRIEDVQIDLGRGLLSLVDPDQGAKLLERMTSVRRHIALHMGLLVPKVATRDTFELKPNAYVILVRGVEVAKGEVQVNQFLAIGPEEKLKNLRGTKTVDPTYGMPGVWITPEQRGDAERLRCMFFDSVSVMATQITEVLRSHSSELLTFQTASELLDAPHLQAVLARLEEQGIGRVRLWQTLRSLLQERVSIRDLQRICDGLLTHASSKLDDEGLLDYARRALGDSIAREYMNKEGTINCCILPEEMQQDVLEGRNTTEIRQRLMGFVQKLQERGVQPVFVSKPQVRPRLLELLPNCRNVVSLSSAEIPARVNLNNLGA